MYDATEDIPDFPRLIVRYTDNTLVLHTPDLRLGVLVPQTDTRFGLQATPLKVEFVLQNSRTPHLRFTAPSGQVYEYEHVGNMV